MVCVRSLVPKLKKSACCGDLVGGQSGSRQLDHGPDLVGDADRALSKNTSSAVLMVSVPHELQLFGEAHQGDHDLHVRGVAGLGQDVAGGLHDGLHLHGEDLRVLNAQAAAARAQAWGWPRAGP